MTKRFVLDVDAETERALKRLARVQDRSRAAVVRALVKDAARRLDAERGDKEQKDRDQQ